MEERIEVGMVKGSTEAWAEGEALVVGEVKKGILDFLVAGVLRKDAKQRRGVSENTDLW